MPQIEEYASIAARLRELEVERLKALEVPSPIVTDPAPPDYVEPAMYDPWGFYAG